MQPKKASSAAGFTLIELAIVITIAGLLVAGGASAYTIWLKQQRLDTTKSNLETLRNAFQSYLDKEGAMPCPAPLGVPKSDPGYGKSVACNGAAKPNTFLVNGRANLKVRVGAVPVRTLGFPDNTGQDGWGHLLVYAVSDDLANPATPYTTANAAIYLKDGFGNDATDPPGTAPYILVSPGADGNGAYTPEGVLVAPCLAGTTADGENCNYDTESLATFAVAEFSSTSIDDSHHYDDYTEYRKGESLALPKCDTDEVLTTDSDGKPKCVTFDAGQCTNGTNVSKTVLTQCRTYNRNMGDYNEISVECDATALSFKCVNGLWTLSLTDIGTLR